MSHLKTTHVDKIYGRDFVKNPTDYDGIDHRKYQHRNTKTLTHVGEKAYAIEHDTLTTNTA
jgi:hypothetical protein